MWATCYLSSNQNPPHTYTPLFSPLCPSPHLVCTIDSIYIKFKDYHVTYIFKDTNVRFIIFIKFLGLFFEQSQHAYRSSWQWTSYTEMSHPLIPECFFLRVASREIFLLPSDLFIIQNINSSLCLNASTTPFKKHCYQAENVCRCYEMAWFSHVYEPWIFY